MQCQDFRKDDDLVEKEILNVPMARSMKVQPEVLALLFMRILDQVDQATNKKYLGNAGGKKNNIGN